ncbi:hypothetical protein [Streptomyces sp. NPDC026294]|uniref:hypothetical protein n=1 Tax=unclassified Streptomyces TaxID=2593676 RepID=UPI0033C9C66C
MLAPALGPEPVDSLLPRLELLLDDPGHVELTRRGGDARSWEPDDPRTGEPAPALTGELLADRARLTMPADFGNQSDAAARYGLVNRHGEDQAPPIARLNTLIEANLRAVGVGVPWR